MKRVHFQVSWKKPDVWWEMNTYWSSRFIDVTLLFTSYYSMNNSSQIITLIKTQHSSVRHEYSSDMCGNTNTHDMFCFFTVFVEQRFRFDFQFHEFDSGQIDDRRPVCCLILVVSDSSVFCEFVFLWFLYKLWVLLIVTVCFPLYVDRDYILNTVGLDGNLSETGGGERFIWKNICIQTNCFTLFICGGPCHMYRQTKLQRAPLNVECSEWKFSSSRLS